MTVKEIRFTLINILIFFAVFLINPALSNSEGFFPSIKTAEPITSFNLSNLLNRVKQRALISKVAKNIKAKPFYLVKPKSINLLNPPGFSCYYCSNYRNLSVESSFPPFIIMRSFRAILDDNTVIPPDTMGAVGDGYVMTMLNNKVNIQTLTGKSYGEVPLESFWDNISTMVFDPTVIYDFFVKKWVAVAAADPGKSSSKILIAISETPNPLQRWDIFYFYADSRGEAFADYPRVGLNSKWIAITTNMYSLDGSHYLGPKMWVIVQNSLKNRNLKYKEFPAGFDNLSGFTIVPSVSYDINEPNLYLVDDSFIDSMEYPLIRVSEITGSTDDPQWKPTPDGGGSFPGTGLFYPHINFNYRLIKAYQKGATERIDTDDVRIENAIYINGKLWFTHTGGLPATGTPDRTAVFWYEVDPKLLDTTGDPIVQSGVVDPGEGGCLFYPSIAVNRYNDVVIGFSRSDKTRYAEAAFVSRSSWDSPGTMSEIKTIKKGEAPYRKEPSSEATGDLVAGGIRWGDYSSTVIDPSDNTTFWTIQEYAAKPFPGGLPRDDRWGTWWVEINPLFPDIHGRYSWAEQSIIDIYTHHITTGYPDGTYKPNALVTRAQMAAFIARAMKLNVPDECNSSPFYDVDTNTWYCKYVEAIKSAGITTGYPDGSYRPDGYVTRAEMAAFLVKALHLNTQPCTTKPFVDVPIDAWYCPYVQALKNAGITTGYPDGTYRPDEAVTRAEMAVFLDRSFIR